MKSIGIIAALGRELREIRNGIKITEQKVIKGYKFSEGYIGNNRVILACSSVGKVNAAICTEIMISNYDLDYVINTGIAGSLNSEVKILDVVVASEIGYHDIQSYILEGCYPFQKFFKSSPGLIDMVKDIGKDYLFGEDNLFHLGKIVSGDSFVSCPDHKKEIINQYAPLCVEMEGAAIAHTCYINEVPFIIVRAISDGADELARENYKENELSAANQAGKFILEILNKIV